MENIVVMGGSFNPPTIGHVKVIQTAMQAVNAGKGIFIPVSRSYLNRKMKKTGFPQESFSEDIRVEMLKSICKHDQRLNVDTVQITRSDRKYDYEILSDLKTQNPDANLFLIAGSDKLIDIPRWHKINALITDFNLIVVKRGKDDLEELRSSSPWLDKNWSAFQIVDVPGIEEISAAVFRNKLRAGDQNARDMVPDHVWNILDENGKVPWHAITNFDAVEHKFLSNFYKCDVEYNGLIFKSSEAAFQAQKCMTDEERLQFTKLSPSKAKSTGKTVELRPDWEQVKLNIMEDILRQKFMQNPDIAEKLVATGNKTLVEENTWRDIYWGVNKKTGEGENQLGKILMKVRDELLQNR